jgi:uncharacterized protein (TIGR02996 family)
MTDPAAMLQAVCADSNNVGLRLIYADFLEEQGDPRADFIRVQCELASLPEHDDRRTALEERELALLNRHGAAWVNQLELAYRPCRFRRGFVESLTMGADEFLANAERLLRLTPLREVHLTTLGSAEALADSPFLGRLSHLRVGVVSNSDVVALCRSPYLGRLRGLTLAGSQLGLEGMRALLACSALGGLRELGLHDSPNLGPTEVELLASQSPFAELEVLHLEAVNLGEVGLQALAGSRRFGNLRRLKLRRCHLTDGGGRALAASGAFPALTELDLCGNRLQSGTLAGLADFANASLAQLRVLRLSENVLSSAAIRRLLESAHLGDLHHLELCHCGITEAKDLATFAPASLRILDLGGNYLRHEVVEQLAQSPRLAGLRQLNLSFSKITPWGVKALTWSPHLAGLRSLDLSGNPVDQDGLLALGACPPRPHLTTLDLSGWSLTDGALGALHAWPHLPALCRLALAMTDLTDDGARHLAACPLLEKLTHLDLSDTAITSEGVHVLLASPYARRLQSLLLEGVSLDDETRALVRGRFFAQSYLRG